MKIFIDSAKLEEIEKINSLGILDGVTTNPSLIKRVVKENYYERLDMEEYLKRLVKLMKGKSVSLEVGGSDFKTIVRQGISLFKKFNHYGKNIYIKVPISTSEGKNRNLMDGLKSIKFLSMKKIPVNCTLIFSPEQALLAAKAGAKIVSPFLGRVDDYLRDKGKIRYEREDYYPKEGLKKGKRILEDKGIVSGIDLLKKCVELFRNYNIKTWILAASLRNSRQVREAGLAGTDIVTIPFRIFEEMIIHEKTTEGNKKFMNDLPEKYKEIMM